MKPKLLNAIHNLFATFTAAVVLVLVAGHAAGQIDDVPTRYDSLGVVGGRQKIPLEKGKYRLVEKNKSGQIVSVIEYAPIETDPSVIRKVKESYVSWRSGDGTSFHVTVVTYEDDPDNAGAVRDAGEAILVYKDGALREKKSHKAKSGRIEYGMRTMTRYTPGQTPDAVTQREKRLDAEKDTWIKASPFEGTTWRLEVDGEKQDGEYTFGESPGITEVRHDSKIWLLMFSANVEKRTLVLPAESKDHLGFARRFIQLRGDADAGRLEFWLTQDETAMDFKPTPYALVREDN